MQYKKSGRVAKFIYVYTITFIALLAVVSTFGQSSRMVEGKDYITFNRVRIIDEMGFDKPVEAMSMLVPKGWKAQGNIRWNSMGGCRDEIVVLEVLFTSPDGSYILTNNSLFNPAVELKENWVKMQKAPQ